MMPTPQLQAQAVLNFWFEAPDDPAYGQSRAAWFKKDEQFDAAIQARFAPLIDMALDGALAHWAEHAQVPVALAQIIVLDQFTRNVFRGTARAFAGDAQALGAARVLVDSGRHLQLNGVQRQFAYLPFEHAEDLDSQRRSVALFEQLARDEPALADLPRWARAHHDIVARFGRFPHRNQFVNRSSTVEEVEFLKQPGSSF